jgi:hypothetical protein
MYVKFQPFILLPYPTILFLNKKKKVKNLKNKNVESFDITLKY